MDDPRAMTADAETCLEAHGLSKRYPAGVEAVRDLSLVLRKGEVLGLAGPNGAGKSTLLKLLAGLLRTDRGTVAVEGLDITGNPSLAARKVALMTDPLGVYLDITSREYLEFFGRAFGLEGPLLRKRVDEVVERTGLGPWIESDVETLSAGWQRRLALGRAILSEAPVILLDEPAAGLDIGARSDLLSIVRRLAGAGRTMIVSSHILPELEDLADTFAIMTEGSWAEVGPGKVFFDREDLRTGFGKDRVFELRLDGALSERDRAEKALLAAAPGLDIAPVRAADGTIRPDALHIHLRETDRGSALLAALVREGLPIAEWRACPVALGDAVLQIVQGRE